MYLCSLCPNKTSFHIHILHFHYKNRLEQTPFFLACWKGNTSCVRLLLKDQRVNNLNGPDNEAYTPLRWAAYNGYFDVMNFQATGTVGPFFELNKSVSGLTVAHIASPQDGDVVPSNATVDLGQISSYHQSRPDDFRTDFLTFAPPDNPKGNRKEIYFGTSVQLRSMGRMKQKIHVVGAISCNK